ncbi:hypothetical protein LINGRAHAP2_LOCUS21891 [Linum grandiflorum]
MKDICDVQSTMAASNPDDASKSSKDLIENHSHSDVLANKTHENDDIFVELDKRVETGWHMPHHDHSKCVEEMEAALVFETRCLFHRHGCKCMQTMKDELVREIYEPEYVHVEFESDIDDDNCDDMLVGDQLEELFSSQDFDEP